MSTINVTNLSGRGGATPNLPDGANITGVATATSFSGNISGNVTGNVTGNIVSSGISTLGNVVITGAVGGGGTVGAYTGVTTFYGDGSGLTGVGETVAPWYYNPDVSQVDAYVDTGIGITFNKRILVGAGGSITLRLVGAAGTVVQNWGISSVTVNAVDFNASLVSNLENNTTYHLTIGDGFFTDASGTSYVGTAYTFDTSGTAAGMLAMGRDEVGTLGNNTDNNHVSSPTQIPGTTWKNMINSGNRGMSATGAVKSDGTMWTWGQGNFGQTGQNSNVNVSSPVQVGSDTTWSTTYGTFSGGYLSMAAVKSDGTLWTWGNSNSGQGGRNDNTNRSSPVQIPGTTWNAVITDGKNGVATKTDGTLWTWGNNTNGELGVNNRTNYSSPIQVPGTTWVAGKIATGQTKCAAIKTDGTLWSWGYNHRGQLGHNDVVRRSSPVQVPGTTWATVTAGYNDMIASKTDGTLWAFGQGASGALAQNNDDNISSPVQIPGTNWSTAMNDYAGSVRNHLAVTQDGKVFAWGGNQYGELGFNDTVFRSSPTQIPGVLGVNQVVMQSDYSYGILLTDPTP